MDNPEIEQVVDLTGVNAAAQASAETTDIQNLWNVI
jgi:hypothetical protein